MSISREMKSREKEPTRGEVRVRGCSAGVGIDWGWSGGVSICGWCAWRHFAAVVADPGPLK